MIAPDITPPPPTVVAPNFALSVDPALGFERANEGIRFHFSFGEIPTTGYIEPQGDNYRLSVRATVGVIPYSIEDRQARADLLSGLGEITRASGGAVTVDPKQAIIICGESQIKAPLAPLTVISEMVALMIRARPYFETVGELLPDLIAALPARPK